VALINATVTAIGTPATSSPASGTYTPDNAPSFAVAWLLDDFDSAPTTGTVVYGSDNMTLATGSSVLDPTFSQSRIQLYYVNAPAAGAQTVSAPWTGGSNTNRRMYVASFTATHASAPLGTVFTATGTGVSDTPGSSPTDSATDDIIIDAMIAIIVPTDSTFTVGAGQTQKWNVNVGDAKIRCGSWQAGASGAQLMSWTNNGAPLGIFSWVSVSVAIKNAAAGGSVVPVLASQYRRRWE
jgi:hypothetical protein